MDFATRRAEGSIFNLAYNGARNLDNFAKSFTRMNTIAALLAPFLFTMVQAVLQLAAALVSVASAASMAAASLGGALLSGLMQLLPVVGLLVAAFSRLSLIMQASQMMTKGIGASHLSAARGAREHREATEKLADSQYSLKQAYQQVRDAASNVKDAERQLTEARRQARRDLVDINFAETDAMLAQKDATLALLEAKKRLADMEHQQAAAKEDIQGFKDAIRMAQDELAAAQARGDQAGIISATQRITELQQELGAAAGAGAGQNIETRRARLDVAEAAQRKKEADVAAARAVEDRNRAERAGVEGAPAVVAAEKSLRSATEAYTAAIHNLAKAKREAGDAGSDIGMAGATAENPLQRLLNQLDPAEKRVLKIVQGFKKLWKQTGRDLTDAIVTAVGDAILELEKLLRDKKFMRAFQGLANTIGDQIRRLARFFTSPEQRHFFEQFATLASHNLPKIVGIFEKIVLLAEKIASAFDPVFEHILKGVGGFLGRETDRAGQKARAPRGFDQNRIGAFAARSETYLDAVAHFFGSVLRLLGAIIHVASGPGKDALNSMSDAFERWSKELETTKQKGAREFFSNAIRTSGKLLDLFGKLIALFFRIGGDKNFDRFIEALQKIALPALADVATVYGKMFDAIARASNNPALGTLLRVFTDLYLLSKLTPLGMIAHSAWHTAVVGLLSQIAFNTGGLPGGVLGKALGRLGFGKGAAGKGAATMEEKLASGAGAGAAASAESGAVAGAEGAASAGIAARLMAPIRGAGRLLARVFILAIIAFITYELVKIFLPDGAIGKYIYKAGQFAGKLWAYWFVFGVVYPLKFFFYDLPNMISKWVQSVASLFASVGGRIASFLVRGVKRIGRMILGVIVALPGMMMEAALAVADKFESVGSAIGGWIGNGIKKILGQTAQDAADEAISRTGTRAAERNSYYAARVGYYERQGLSPTQARAKARADTTAHFKREGGIIDGKSGERGSMPGSRWLNAARYAAGGAIKGMGAAVPIIAHVGEWVLNMQQQTKLARALGKPPGWIKDFLFGARGGGEHGPQGDASPKQAGAAAQRRARAARMLKAFGNAYYGPQASDWLGGGDGAFSDATGTLGYEQHPGSGALADYAEPVFANMPTGAWVEVGRKNWELMQRAKGFWLPEFVKKATTFSRATRAQVQSWKESNVLSGLAKQNLDPPFLRSAMRAILRSPLWNYDTGGVVGWNPNASHIAMPSFAAGGIVTTPAVVGRDRSAAGVNQQFQIQTSSPHVDVDYVMRVAKIHAEASF